MAFAVQAYDYSVPLDSVSDNSAVNGQMLYQGFAEPGTADTAGVLRWRIRKFFYDGSGVPMGHRWANGTFDMNKDWSLRASYTYASL